jgi:hypothetical protein
VIPGADPLVAELVDLIEHEPKRGGSLGLSEMEWQSYREEVEQSITSLERGY